MVYLLYHIHTTSATLFIIFFCFFAQKYLALQGVVFASFISLCQKHVEVGVGEYRVIDPMEKSVNVHLLENGKQIAKR